MISRNTIRKLSKPLASNAHGLIERKQLSLFDKRPDLTTIAIGAACAAYWTQGLNETQLLFLFLMCIVGIGTILVSEIFRMIE
jgi:hypothetical protein